MTTVLDPWATLGVSRGATNEEIRAAYRRRARATHPDHGGSDEAFRAVCAAYAALSGTTDPRRARTWPTGEAAGTTGARWEEPGSVAEAEAVHRAARERLERLRMELSAARAAGEDTFRLATVVDLAELHEALTASALRTARLKERLREESAARPPVPETPWPSGWHGVRRGVGVAGSLGALGAVIAGRVGEGASVSASSVGWLVGLVVVVAASWLVRSRVEPRAGVVEHGAVAVAVGITAALSGARPGAVIPLALLPLLMVWTTWVVTRWGWWMAGRR